MSTFANIGKKIQQLGNMAKDGETKLSSLTRKQFHFFFRIELNSHGNIVKTQLPFSILHSYCKLIAFHLVITSSNFLCCVSL